MLKKQYQKSKKVCKVTFTLPVEALEANNEVRVVGDFNDWNYDSAAVMKATKKEYKAVIELPLGKQYEFRYVADNGNWENDWAADAYVASPFAGIENSVVIVDEVLDTPVAKKATSTKKASTPRKTTTAKKATAAKKTTATPAKKVAATPAAKKATKKVVVKKTLTTKKAAPAKAKKDDLKKIEGIGPKIARLLNEAGIFTFAELAAAKTTVLEEVLKNAGPRFKMHKPTTWAAQAKLADKGDWEGLKKWQDELDGGKVK